MNPRSKRLPAGFPLKEILAFPNNKTAFIARKAVKNLIARSPKGLENCSAVFEKRKLKPKMLYPRRAAKVAFEFFDKIKQPLSEKKKNRRVKRGGLVRITGVEPARVNTRS